MEEVSTGTSMDGKVEIVIDEASNMINRNSCVPASAVVATPTEDNSEIVTDPGGKEKPSESEIKGGQLFKHLIPKVPRPLRNHENNEGVFDPKVVSIGPYHRGREDLQFVESVKPIVAGLFVSDSAIGKNMDEYYTKVLEKVDDARSCYVAGGSTDKYTLDEFAKMMLLDGCFILGMIESFFLKFVDNKPKYDDVITHLGMLVWNLTFGDIFYLLEKELLMSLKFENDEGTKMIHAWLNFQISGDVVHLKNRNEVKVNNIDRQPLHLLQLYRTKYLNEPLDINVSRRGTKKEKFQYDLLKDKHNVKDVVYSFRSVIELKAKGIHFRPNSSRSLKSIKFKSCCCFGQLQLPLIFVTPKTKIYFSNMIAYELCSGNLDDLAIISYISFMKSLIDNSNDVKELRSKHILFNKLGSDEEVANAFKEINTFAMEDVGVYVEVKQNIQDHYNSIAKTWMAEFIHKYFSRPWTVIAFIAATSLLVLAFLQTFFTISPRSGHK